MENILHLAKFSLSLVGILAPIEWIFSELKILWSSEKNQLEMYVFIWVYVSMYILYIKCNFEKKFQEIL